ncbi:MAG TPA: phosphatase PAP2 family protein, partial [Burkholderiaceae bacterium]
FPSGHTLVMAAFAMSAALVAGTLWPGARVPALVLAFAWTVLVGLSRLVLGVHWPTDVVVAACLGTAIPLAFSLALELRKRAREHDRHSTPASSIGGGR